MQFTTIFTLIVSAMTASVVLASPVPTPASEAVGLEAVPAVASATATPAAEAGNKNAALVSPLVSPPPHSHLSGNPW